MVAIIPSMRRTHMYLHRRTNVRSGVVKARLVFQSGMYEETEIKVGTLYRS
jgi:hypothetical protein